MNIRRPKQPEAVRQQILDAAQHVLAHEGHSALTFERVLSKTDLSKGGMQHHFRTKQALQDSLFEALLDGFRTQFNEVLTTEPEGPAQHIRTYIKTTCINALEMAEGPRAAVILLLQEPLYRTTWNEFVDAVCGLDTLDPQLMLTCRYAAEGLWYAHVFSGVAEPEHIAAVQGTLLSMTQQTAHN